MGATIGQEAAGLSKMTARLARRRRSIVAPVVLLLLPATALLTVFFIVPFGTLAVNSLFGFSRVTGIIHDLSLENYERIWLDSRYQGVIASTLIQSVLASLATLLVGYPVAYYISRATARAKAVVIIMVLSPLLISVVVRSFGWVIVLGPDGLTTWLFGLVGLAGGDILNTQAAVIVGLTNVFLPFMVLSIATSLQVVNPQVPLAAASLGASPWRVFWHVVLPLSLPGVLSGLLIVFSLASSAFVTPALLGGARYMVLSTAIYEQTLILQNWPLGSALAVTLVVIVIAILTIQTRLIERGHFRAVFS
ncbi:ABC transporter permease [Thalassobaculum sp.]|uniref:ABC transporter permease n=1 Tax=Thalassobaculum sp. TaxID=2022740 RepID=UPI0032EB7F3C